MGPKRKRGKTRRNTFESDANGCGTPENTFSSKTSTYALDMLAEYASTQCLREKEQNILSQAEEKDNGESDIQDKACNCNSVVASVVLFAKDSMLEVVNEKSSKPDETGDSMKNGHLVKNHDEDLEVHDLFDKFQCIKTYSRKKLNNVHCAKDHHNDDLHEVSEGPLTDGLMEIETEHSTDQNKVEVEEMELIAENSYEQRSITKSSIADIPLTQLEETNDREVDHAEVTRNDLCCPGNVSGSSLVTVNGGNSNISQWSVERPIVSNSKNKLLILDVNGLLAYCASDVPNGYNQREPDFWVRRRKLYKRPFCNDFLQFCFDRFHVGVWSSIAKCDADDIIKFLMGKSASRLLFCWNQSDCTTTEFSTVENWRKPLVLKDLRKLWEKLEPGLPWEKGEFHESNTLLLDESPDTALVNPMHTAIFPYSYRHYHTKDSSLGPKGDLREYLERLAKADNVQEFVSLNEFGQRPIRPANPSWGYYLKVRESVKCRENDMPSAPDGEQTA